MSRFSDLYTLLKILLSSVVSKINNRVQFLQEHSRTLFLSSFLLRKKQYLVNLRCKLFEVVRPYCLSIFPQIQCKVHYNLLFHKSFVQVKHSNNIPSFNIHTMNRGKFVNYTMIVTLVFNRTMA